MMKKDIITASTGINLHCLTKTDLFFLKVWPVLMCFTVSLCICWELPGCPSETPWYIVQICLFSHAFLFIYVVLLIFAVEKVKSMSKLFLFLNKIFFLLKVFQTTLQQYQTQIGKQPSSKVSQTTTKAASLLLL